MSFVGGGNSGPLIGMPPPSFSRPIAGGGIVGAPANASAAAHPDTIAAATQTFGATPPPGAGNQFTASTGKNTTLGG